MLCRTGTPLNVDERFYAARGEVAGCQTGQACCDPIRASSFDVSMGVMVCNDAALLIAGQGEGTLTGTNGQTGFYDPNTTDPTQRLLQRSGPVTARRDPQTGAIVLDHNMFTQGGSSGTCVMMEIQGYDVCMANHSWSDDWLMRGSAPVLDADQLAQMLVRTSNSRQLLLGENLIYRLTQ
jgi:hypothetical protein